ncbi:Protein of unknown function [Bacillus mycoides]|nr:Protein of unknown function [Bacillus mycoides]
MMLANNTPEKIL